MMNNEDTKKLQYMKYTLEDYKRRKIKTKEWKLNKLQREYLESLGYQIEPVIYEITTKTFKDLYHIQNPLIKEIHYASKAGKKRIGKSLKEADKKVLKEYKVRFYPVKFRIIIIPQKNKVGFMNSFMGPFFI